MYKVLRSHNLDTLVELVNGYLLEGWEVVRGVLEELL
jgi:hypothetical protein